MIIPLYPIFLIVVFFQTVYLLDVKLVRVFNYQTIKKH